MPTEYWLFKKYNPTEPKYNPTEPTEPTDPSLKLIKQITDFKVRTKKDMKQLVKLFLLSIIAETGKVEFAYNIEKAILESLQPPNIPEPKDDIKNDGSFYPTIFLALRSNALGANAPETSNAILSSAGWFYYNMEKPQQKNAKIARYGSDEDNLIFKEQKKQYQQSKSIRWSAIGLSVLLSATMLYFGLRPKKKARNPRKRISSSVRKVSKSKTKKRNRKSK